MLTSKLTKSAGANCKFMQLVKLQISVWVYTQAIKQEGLHTGTATYDPHKFCHLK